MQPCSVDGASWAPCNCSGAGGAGGGAGGFNGVGGGGVAGAGATCTPVPAVPTGTRAAAFQLDAAHSGAQPAEHIGIPLCERWSVPFGGNVVAGDGLVWVVDGDIRALDAATGAVVWGPLGGPSSLAYDGGRLYSLEWLGALRAMDGATGTVLWTSTVGDETFGSPVVRGGRVVAVGIDGGSTAQVYARAYDTKTGALAWSNNVPFGAQSPALGAAMAYISSGCGTSSAFDLGGGAPVWQHSGPCPGGVMITPSLLTDGLYVYGLGATALVLDALTGAVKGPFAASRAPAGAGDQGFFVNGSLLQRIPLAHQLPTWTLDAGETIAMPPLVLGSLVFTVTASGLVYAVDTASGLVVSSANVGESITTKTTLGELGLAAADGRLFVSTKSRLVAY